MRLIILFFIVLLPSASFAQDKVVAFPGAEGFVKYTTGGRGGKVIKVTNLNDNGTGSLRAAIKVKEPRIIIFEVSGNIELESPLEIKSGNVTIAGHSAPGDGVCIKNYPVSLEADNVIIRYMRFRLGDEKRTQSDAFSGNQRNQNIIIDHCSMSWAIDECASFYRNKNFTMQWCIISESLNASVHEKGEHGYGGIWGGINASFHHNLLANHNSRLPRFSGSSTTPNPPDELVDFRNNVIYNWMHNNTYGGEKGRYNIVNNYYKPGPATNAKKLWMLNPSSPYGKFFVKGNHLEGQNEITANNILGIKTDSLPSVIIGAPFNSEEIQYTDAEQAFDAVLKSAGASFSRDAVDKRIVDEVRSGKSYAGKNKNGIIDSQKDVGGWPELKSSAPDKDADNDGLPDQWEKRNKLDPNNALDSSVLTANGLSSIENYLNELVSKKF